MALGAILSGIGAAAGAVGNIFGIGNKRQDERQIKQQQKLTDMQSKANEEAAERSQQRSMEMWNATNYGATKKHMEDAGLNPALLYGMSGGGGATTAAPAEQGVSGGQAASGAENQKANSGMGMALGQAALIAAQVEATKAQAEKTKVETEKIAGVDTKLGEAQTGMIDVSKRLAEIQLEIAGATQSQAIDRIISESEKMTAEAVQAQQTQVITENTMEEQIQRIKTESIGALIENEVKRSGISMNDARIKEIAASIEQRWRGQEIDVENNKRMTEAMLWGAGIHAAGGLVGGIVNIAGKGVPNVVKQIK